MLMRQARESCVGKNSKISKCNYVTSGMVWVERIIILSCDDHGADDGREIELKGGDYEIIASPRVVSAICTFSAMMNSPVDRKKIDSSLLLDRKAPREGEKRQIIWWNRCFGLLTKVWTDTHVHSICAARARVALSLRIINDFLWRYRWGGKKKMKNQEDEEQDWWTIFKYSRAKSRPENSNRPILTFSAFFLWTINIVY